MFDGVLKITKHPLPDEHSSQLSAINSGKARIVTSIFKLIGYFLDIAEASQLRF